MEPLKVPDNWPNVDSPRSRAHRKYPVVGWIVGAFLPSKFRMLDQQVKSELQSRQISIQNAWGQYPQYIDIVMQLQKILNECLWDFEPAFVPEDSYWLLGQCLTGDLCELEAIMKIEDTFKLKITWDFFCQKDFSVLELVEYINANQGTAPNIADRGIKNWLNTFNAHLQSLHNLRKCLP